MHTEPRQIPGLGYELRFVSLFDAGRAFVFPCDRTGRVDLDRLSTRMRSSYFFARHMVGQDLGAPQVLPLAGTAQGAFG